jgi:hypothetical protein
MSKRPNTFFYAAIAIVFCALALATAIFALVVILGPREVHFNLRFYAIMALGMLIMSLAAVTGVTSGLHSRSEERVPAIR